jgi:hypothetical protein
MFDQLSAEIPASLIKGFLRTTRTTTTITTKQNVDPAVHFVYSRVKMTNESKVDQIYIFYFSRGARPGTASGCFKKATQTPKAGHPI